MYDMTELDDNARKLMIIAGLIIYILGFIGNILNICIFTIWARRRTTSHEHHNVSRTNNSPLYLLASSVSNLIVILYPLLTRIVLDGYNYTVLPNNVFILCQFRFFVLHTFDIISLIYVCMATFDRYLITSQEVHLRHLSTTRHRTIQVIFIIFIVNALHSIPIAIYYRVSNTGYCQMNSTGYLYYYLYVFQILLHGIMPIIFLSIFGLLTFKNLKRLRNQANIHNHDKQLSNMLFLMSFAIIISSIPYCIQQIYYVMISGENSGPTSLVFLFHVISTILFYTNSVSSFYIYFVSTPNFRHQIQKLLRWNKLAPLIRHNKIHAITKPHQMH